MMFLTILLTVAGIRYTGGNLMGKYEPDLCDRYCKDIAYCPSHNISLNDCTCVEQVTLSYGSPGSTTRQPLASTTVQASCPANYSRVDMLNLCWKVVVAPKLTFDQAKVACEEQGAHLIHLDTEAKIHLFNNFYRDRYNRTGLRIGLRDQPSYARGDFRWTDGSRLTVNDWSHRFSQPDKYRMEDCVAIEAERDFKWGDVYCSDMNGYTCEILLLP